MLPLCVCVFENVIILNDFCENVINGSEMGYELYKA